MNQRTAIMSAALLATIASLADTAGAAETKAAPPATATAAAAGHEITKEQAVEMALQAHPGKVTKAYEDTKKGKKTWEVKIDGADGKKWEVYYDIKTGERVAEESK
jgi:uncharacterized membrane protein YkoI